MGCILKKTSQFKASFKLAKKRGLDISLLEEEEMWDYGENYSQ